jgi:hypothetical protein
MQRAKKPLLILASLACFVALGWVAIGLGQEAREEQPQSQPAQQPDQQVQHSQAPLQQPAQVQANQQQPQAQRQAQRRRLRQGPLNPEHQRILEECIRHCRECAQICNRTSWHAYRQAQAGGANAEAMQDAQQLTGDCQAACEFAVRLMERNSTLMADACRVCEQACTECAEACEQLGQDQQLAECARICRQCAEACKQMVEAHGGEHAGH